MKKIIFVLLVLTFFSFFKSSNHPVFAQTTDESPPIICGCPTEINKIYQERQTGERCVVDYDEFKKDPTLNHLWVEDQEITAQGKADDRARQFIYWVVTHSSIDNHPVLLKVWSTARNVAYFFVLLVAAMMGVGMIVAQRSNFSAGIKVWPSVWKILLILLYISFSASLVITVVQLSEILMKFFIENLGGKDLFNIYFASISQEKNYLDFVGCRDLNIRVQEAVGAEMFLLKMTNVTYYVMGSMLILRKVLLWFLLFVSPFLAILMPFIFIRNIGWIWIGVFFQWVFYGPLFALFLGALATIWKGGIPFIFDFSRAGTTAGYVYPTAINILYGGPAQRLAILNNGNYVDTFAEYVITLIMLWAVTFFPWWLLRIFRDYCCEGIMATKNILMSMYDHMRGGPPLGPTPTPSPTTISTALKIPKEMEIPVKVRLETMEEIKKAKTEEIARSLNISASKMADVAHFETNKELRQTAVKNLQYLQNPTQAETPSQRQKYMNIRTELYSRVLKEDRVAGQVLSSISPSKVEQIQKREALLQSISRMVPVTKLTAVKVKVAEGEKIKEAVAIPEKPIEQVIAVPPTVSIEDYEQVKRMWKSQYEKGEVPVTENITSREEWVEQDIVFITNALNKLLSPNKELQQEGLDDIGYILPIFLVNNLSGEQLVVYLKAKVEAAKEVKEEKQKEKEIAEKLKAKTEEEKIEVEKPKERAEEKAMEMKEEIKSETLNPKSETNSNDENTKS
jgi:hypothetical protein